MTKLRLDDAQAITVDTTRLASKHTVALQIHTLESELYFDVWSLPVIEQTLLQPHNRALTVLYDNQLIGYAIYSLIYEIAEILRIGVSICHQRQGIASRLMRDVIIDGKKNDAKSMNLEVRSSNISAIRLYQKFGFNVTHTRPNYYRNPDETSDDALMMTLAL